MFTSKPRAPTSSTMVLKHTAACMSEERKKISTFSEYILTWYSKGWEKIIQQDFRTETTSDQQNTCGEEKYDRIIVTNFLIHISISLSQSFRTICYRNILKIAIWLVGYSYAVGYQWYLDFGNIEVKAQDYPF